MASYELQHIEMRPLAEFIDFIKGVHTESEQKFPGALLREMKDTNMSFCDIETALQYLKQANRSLEDLNKHFSNVENKLLQSQVVIQAKERDNADMRSNTEVGRKGTSDSGVFSVDSCVFAQMSIEEENNNQLIVQPNDHSGHAEAAMPAMPAVSEVPAEVSLTKPSEHTDSCESDTDA